MKKIILISLVLFHTFSIARGDLIQVPGDAIDDEGIEGNGSSTISTNDMPKDGSSVDEYVTWMNKNFEQARKVWLMRFAKYVHPKNIKCLDFAGAYGFEQVNSSKTHYRFNCFAVPTKDKKSWITHMLTYETKFSYYPHDCVGEDDIRAFFNTESNRTKVGIQQKLAFIKASCTLSAPNAQETTIQKSKFDPSKLDEILENKTDVETYLVTHGRAKGSNGDTEDKNKDCTDSNPYNCPAKSAD